jgi:hypothetical protein
MELFSEMVYVLTVQLYPKAVQVATHSSVLSVAQDSISMEIYANHVQFHKAHVVVSLFLTAPFAKTKLHAPIVKLISIYQSIVHVLIAHSP